MTRQSTPGNPVADAYALGYQAAERAAAMQIESLRGALRAILADPFITAHSGRIAREALTRPTVG